MLSLFSQLSRFNPFNPLTALSASVIPADSVALNLMERAEATAGRSPYESQQLRGAAQAWLSVVR